MEQWRKEGKLWVGKGLLGPVGQEHNGLLGSRDSQKLEESEHLGKS